MTATRTARRLTAGGVSMTDKRKPKSLEDCFDRAWKRIRAMDRICIKTGRDYRPKPVKPPRPLDLVEWH